MSTCIAVYSDWLYHGRLGGVTEIEELSPPNINKTSFICIYKIVSKVKLEDVIRTADWFLIFVPFASLPAHAGEVKWVFLHLLHLFFLCYKAIGKLQVANPHPNPYICVHTHVRACFNTVCSGASPELNPEKYISTQVRMLTSPIFAN